MALDLATFLVRFPEFQSADSAMATNAIAEATRLVDSEIFGAKTDDAVGWKAAHLLALSPYGQQARLSSKEGETTYSKHFRQLVLTVTSGFRVA